MDIKQKVFLIVFNLLLSLGFYIDNKNALFTDISSDSANIIPVCLKKDNPNLFANDLYLDNLQDVEYYTPFYVDLLRFLSNFTQGDYLQSQVILGTILHFVHGILWFLLFYNIRKDFWVSLLMMLFTKGVIWLPGAEIFGITELWTIMPRTVYTALLPLPFLLFRHLKKYNLSISALVLGFILNFHPISGIGGIIGYLSLFISYLYFNKQIDKTSIIKVLNFVLFCLIGMFPYLFIYFTKVNPEQVSDAILYESAFNKRIPKVFSNPIEFIKDWNRPVFYFYLTFFILFFFVDKSEKRKIFKSLLFTVLIIFLTSNLSVYIEQFINNIFGLSIRMSFQLIRFQKFIILVFQLAMFLSLVNLLSKQNSIRKATLFFVFYVALMFSDTSPINKVPLLGDDICNSTLPMSLKFREKKVSQDEIDFNKMLSYIKDNTPKNAVFFGSYYIRSATKRSVVLDNKGASMVIEGNPEKLIQWHLDTKKFKETNEYDKIELLRSKKVTHILSNKNEWNSLTPIKTIGKTHLYSIE